MPTVSAIISAVALLTNEVSSSEETTYKKWIEQCAYDIETRFPTAPFLTTSADRTVSSGTRTYALPSDFRKMNSVTIAGEDVKLKHITPEQFDILQPSAAEAGTPAIYTIYPGSTNIELYPSPDSSLTLHYRYFKSIDGFSSVSATISDVPTRYHELFELYTANKAYRRRGEMDKAQLVEAQYRTMVDRMKSDFNLMTGEMERMKDVREFQRGNRFGDEIQSAIWD